MTVATPRSSYRVSWRSQPLVRHADGDPADAGPGVEPGAERRQDAVTRWPGKPREPECCRQESAAVEHALLDHVVRLEKQRLRDRDAERFRGLQIDDELELGWPFHG